MKCILVLLIIPTTVFCQHAESINPFQEKADSIVAYFLGTETFQQYVRLDPKASKYRRDGNTTSFDRKPSFTPDSYFYQYNFNHPKFSGRNFVVAFLLGNGGQFIANDETRGLIRIPSPNDSMWISGNKAIKISADQAVKIKKKSLRLAWDSTNVSYDLLLKTHDYRDITTGDIVWRIDGVVKFRGDRYSGTFQVNVLTGVVARHFAIPWD